MKTSLQERMATALKSRLMTETPEFSLHWKDWSMPAGAPIQGLRAGKKTTTASTFSPSLTGWQTPKTPSGGPQAVRRTDGGGLHKLEDQVAVMVEMAPWQTPGTDSFRSRGGDRKDEMGLDQQAHYLAGWPTPRTEDGESCGNHPEKMDSLTGATRTISAWVSPTAQDGSRGSLPPRPWDKGIPLSQQVALASGTSGSSSDPTQKGSIGGLAFSAWPTPQAGADNPAAHNAMSGNFKTAIASATKGTAQDTKGSASLNADFVAWLMSVSPEVMACAPSTSCRKGKSKE